MPAAIYGYTFRMKLARVQKIFPIVIMLSLVLSACGAIEVEVERTPTPDVMGTATIQALQLQNKALEARVATLVTPPDPPLTRQTAPEIIRQRMLYSFRKWKTIWVEGQVRDYAADGSLAQSRRVQAWINQPNTAFRVLVGDDQPGVGTAIISDGAIVSKLDANTGQITRNILPSQARSEYNPPALITTTPEAHPLAAVIHDQLVDLLLPSEIAQRAGALKATSMERIAGREALLVEWLLPDGSLKDRLWVDVVTGVVLRRLELDRGSAQPRAEIVVNAIQFDQDLPGGLFVTDIVEQPQFAVDYTGRSETRAIAAATADPDAAALGDVYFWVENPGLKYQLVRLPGSCLVKRGNCSEPDVLKGHPEPRSQVQPLLWAPDGSAALLVEGLQPARLYLYEPGKEAWQVIASADSIYAAAWSPDGRYIAYSAKTGGANDVYLLRSNASNVVNLTGGKIATPDDNLAHLAWLNPARLLVAVSGAQSTQLFWINIPLGDEQLMMTLPVKGGLAPLPSPDGRYWALTEQTEEKTTLLTGVPFSSARRAVTFAQASIAPLFWSSDSAWLGFVAVSSSSLGSEPNVQADLYVIRPDGSDLQSLLRAPRIFMAAWSPDGSVLLVSADDGQGYSHLFVVPLDGSGVSIIQSPGLYLNTSWLAPSWRLTGGASGK